MGEMDDAWQLLKVYCEEDDDSAFATLVASHLGLVYSAARRQLEDTLAAEEVVQAVFVLLAQKAKTLRPTGSLAVWLYRTACLIAKKHRRQELARRRRETDAYNMNLTDTTHEREPNWNELEPLLEEAMESLDDSGRTAILLRYFQKQSLRQIGVVLGVSEDAARMRVARSVERLRRWFHHRGVTCSATALGTAISAHSIEAVPPTLTVASIQSAVAHASITTSATTSLLTLMVSSKTVFAGALLLGAILPMSWSYLQGPSAERSSTLPSLERKDSVTLLGEEAGGLIAEWKALMTNHGPANGSLSEVYAAIEEINDDFRRRAFRGALIAEWMSRDPREALAFLQINDPGRVTQGLREWVQADSSAAALTMQAEASELRSNIKELLGEIAEVAPELVAALTQGLGQAGKSSRSVRQVFAAMAEQDRSGALVAAQSLSGTPRADALAGVAMAWAKTDGAEALAWAQELEEPAEGMDSIRRSVLVGWAHSDPAAALDHLNVASIGGSSTVFASDTGSAVLREAAQADFEGTLEWIGQNLGKLGQGSLKGLSEALGNRLQEDAQGVLDTLREHPARMDLLPALSHQLLNEGFAEKNAVWRWLGEQTEDSEYIRETRMILMKTTASKEPEVALRWMEESPNVLNDEERFQVIRRLFDNGHELTMVDSLLEQAPTDLRAELLEQSFAYLDRSVGGTLDQWIDRIAELPAEKQGDATAIVARRMASIDPRSAMDWAESRADSEHATAAFVAAANSWAGVDSYEYSQWVAGLPNGLRRDQATHALVTSIVEVEPDSAWTWAKTIESPELRARALLESFRHLADQDPRGVSALLRDPNLTEADTRELSLTD